MKAADRTTHRHFAASSKVTQGVIPRKAVLEMERGVMTAKNVRQSNFGKALLQSLTHDDFSLTSTLNVLRAQSARLQAHFTQERRAFIQRQQCRPDPLIILERPPSPVFTRQARSEPGYMRATAAKPSPKWGVNFRTIDAFSVEKLRRSNAWEPLSSPTVVNTRFHCIAKPSAPLTRFEKRDLMRVLSYYTNNALPQQHSTTSATAPRKATCTKRRQAVKARVQALVMAEEKAGQEEGGPRIFVTEYSDVNVKSSKNRNVSFSKSSKREGSMFSLFEKYSEQNAPVEEETHIDKPDEPALTATARKGEHKAKAGTKAVTAKAGMQVATATQPTKPTPARGKHKKTKQKPERTKYRRAGLKLLPT